MDQGIFTAEQPKQSKTRHRPPATVPDLESLPPTASLTTKQVAMLSGFSDFTLKIWRREPGKRGPKFTTVDGHPRYFVRDVKAWLGLPASSNTEAA